MATALGMGMEMGMEMEMGMAIVPDLGQARIHFQLQKRVSSPLRSRHLQPHSETRRRVYAVMMTNSNTETKVIVACRNHRKTHSLCRQKLVRQPLEQIHQTPKDTAVVRWWRSKDGHGN